ncbi:MAG: SocA family protein [Bacteroidales bacterium]|jgi:uncharacterized phage-associated protein|nr:SocA family protein [Bacteroidales bacterium]
METHTCENFEVKKALNAVLYIASNLKRSDFHKIFKILYFADRNHLSDYGRSITGDTYIAMDDGPVPSNLYDIFKSVRGDGFFKDNGEFSLLFKVVSWDLIKPLKEPNLDHLSKTDMHYIDQALKEYGDMSWDEVREKSHDYAWRNTAKNTPISIDNLMIETGNEESYIEYVKEQILLVKSFKYAFI